MAAGIFRKWRRDQQWRPRNIKFCRRIPVGVGQSNGGNGAPRDVGVFGFPEGVHSRPPWRCSAKPVIPKQGWLRRGTFLHNLVLVLLFYLPERGWTSTQSFSPKPALFSQETS